MHKIWVILKREYLTRVKNKTFIIMTFLGPILMVLVYGGSIYLATRDFDTSVTKEIVVRDEHQILKNKLTPFNGFNFTFSKDPTDSLKIKAAKGDIYAYLEIKDVEPMHLDSIKWYGKKSLSIEQNATLKDKISNEIYSQHLLNYGIRQSSIDSMKPKIALESLEIEDNGEIKKSQTEIKSGIGFILAVVIYMFIFIYGSMVMRGVLEEKTNRIVEVVVSSVKPFQLMMGKILGIAMVGLTQFFAWIILTLVLITAISGSFSKKIPQNNTMNPQTQQAIEQLKDQPVQEGGIAEAVSSLPIAQIIITFLLFFLGGYLLYSSMFAAIGAAINQDTDAQQFMLPVSIPLIVAFIIAQTQVFKDPNGTLVQIFSYIPFTSPVVMVVRSGFAVQWWEIALSFGLLLGTFLLMVWLTGRIYRVGILMYGKKPSWKDLGKWIFVKE